MLAESRQDRDDQSIVDDISGLVLAALGHGGEER